MIDVISFWLFYGILTIPWALVIGTFVVLMIQKAIKWITRDRLVYTYLEDFLEADRHFLVEAYIGIGALIWITVWAVYGTINTLQYALHRPLLPSMHHILSSICSFLVEWLSMPMMLLVSVGALMFGLRKLSDGLFKAKEVLDKVEAKGEAKEAAPEPPVESEPKFKVGQVWETRGGSRVVIESISHSDWRFPISTKCGINLSPDGKLWSNRESKLDLVELIK